MKLKSAFNSAPHSTRNAPSDGVRFVAAAASAGLVACLLFSVSGLAQPQPATFCLNGFTWESVAGVPPEEARKLTLIEHLSLGSQMMFRSPRLRDQMLVSVHDVGTCHNCHSTAQSTDDAMTHVLDGVNELVVIEPSQRGTWFGREYAAFLARPTGDTCEPDGSRVLLAGPPTVDGVLRHRESGSDVRFIIESDDILRALQVPETAPVLLSPRR